MYSKHILGFTLPFATLLGALSGCALSARTVDDLPKTFLEDVNVKNKIDRLPFDHSWVARGIDRNKYRTVVLKPVRIDKLDANSWEKSASAFVTSKEDYVAKAQEVAEYFEKKLREELFNPSSPKHLFELTNKVGKDTIVIEIALTELELSHPIARAGALAVPVPGTSAAISTVTDPHAAFAMRVTDGTTGKLLATAGDRKFALTRVFDVNKLTVSSTAREVVALWAKTIAEAVNSGGITTVEEDTWTLLPW